jgi:hypothetical protein
MESNRLGPGALFLPARSTRPGLSSDSERGMREQINGRPCAPRPFLGLSGPSLLIQGELFDPCLHARQSISEEAPVLAALVGIGHVARPGPMVWTFLFGWDDLRPVGHEFYAPGRHGHVVQVDGSEVKRLQDLVVYVQAGERPPRAALRGRPGGPGCGAELGSTWQGQTIAGPTPVKRSKKARGADAPLA